ncbi:MAG: aminopeptidase P family protein [Actinomycetes bacterium]
MTAHISSARTERLFEILSRGSSSTCLITDLSDIRWLTGFSGSHAWLVIHVNQMFLLTDGRYTEQARAEIDAQQANVEVIECRTQLAMIAATKSLTQGSSVIQFQDSHVSYQLFRLLQTELNASLMPIDASSKFLRRIKDEAEIKIIESACRIADRALAHCRSLLSQGLTECEVRNELDHAMRKFGADGPSYDTIVASGPINASRPHHQPTTTKIESGHTVIIDVGALVSGYHSDMTRSFVVGPMSAEQSEWYEAVVAAQQAGVAACQPGVLASEVDAACRKVLIEAGLEQYFTHGTGHGVGLLIHEEPFINSSATAILQPGDVVTVEPGLYRGGFGGFRVEDLVVITEHGCRSLNSSPKDPTCPPLQLTT